METEQDSLTIRVVIAAVVFGLVVGMALASLASRWEPERIAAGFVTARPWEYEHPWLTGVIAGANALVGGRVWVFFRRMERAAWWFTRERRELSARAADEQRRADATPRATDVFGHDRPLDRR